jgi:hypothetical protein
MLSAPSRMSKGTGQGQKIRQTGWVSVRDQGTRLAEITLTRFAATTFRGANHVRTLKYDRAGNSRPGTKYQANAPHHTKMKNRHLEIAQPFATLFSFLCIVVNMAAGARVPGHIMEGGRTR